MEVTIRLKKDWSDFTSADERSLLSALKSFTAYSTIKIVKASEGSVVLTLLVPESVATLIVGACENDLLLQLGIVQAWTGESASGLPVRPRVESEKLSLDILARQKKANEMIASLKETWGAFDSPSHDERRFDTLVEGLRMIADIKGGYILHEQIDALLSDAVDLDLIERLFERLDELQIKYYDTDEEAQAKSALRNRKRAKKSAIERKTARANTKYDDPVRVYLREMGRVPLLTRQG